MVQYMLIISIGGVFGVSSSTTSAKEEVSQPWSLQRVGHSQPEIKETGDDERNERIKRTNCVMEDGRTLNRNRTSGEVNTTA